MGATEEQSTAGITAGVLPWIEEGEPFPDMTPGGSRHWLGSSAPVEDASTGEGTGWFEEGPR